MRRRPGRLSAYPADPVVLRRWEVEHIFDAEFGRSAGIGSKPRRRLIRADHEAFWQELIRANADAGRIERNLTSMYETADPALKGRLDCWRFANDRAEAQAVAASCRNLIDAGMAHRNYRDLFYEPIPDGLLTERQLKPVQATAELCAQLAEWSPDETLGHRLADICAHVVEVCGKPDAADELRAFLTDLPQDMTLRETFGFLAADRDDDRRKMLDVYALRTGQEIDVEQLVPDRVRIMTMHSAKGLSATVVFIPALEEEVLPGAKRARFPGQVLEAARMLYVSITRARLACVISHADYRFVNGATATHDRAGERGGVGGTSDNQRCVTGHPAGPGVRGELPVDVGVGARSACRAAGEQPGARGSSRGAACEVSAVPGVRAWSCAGSRPWPCG